MARSDARVDGDGIMDCFAPIAVFLHHQRKCETSLTPRPLEWSLWASAARVAAPEW